LTRAAALGLVGLLAGCALAPEPRQPLPALQGVPEAFEMSGRIALRQGDRSEIARLRWTHRPASDLWVISSPLGNEVARLESGPRGARLERGGAEPEEAASFAELSERLIGIPLDPVLLVGWLHNAGASSGGGWQVSVEESQRAGSVDIARRLSAVRGDVTVRLAVDEYRLVEPPR